MGYRLYSLHAGKIQNSQLLGYMHEAKINALILSENAIKQLFCTFQSGLPIRSVFLAI